ncbi:hypothetical protein N7505_007864 [Penicillium chrysogenum]|uniref:Phosphatidylserine decarboxylase proenzyme n=1 Tax=Penicillium chrysogenum TaxID=5076 RepID=A0ABQ8WEK7_PENCH|nr:hypothetical protein N7505_007864 [Penicillium chrysogenum]
MNTPESAAHVEPFYNKPIYSKDIKLYHKPPSRECGSFNEFFSRIKWPVSELLQRLGPDFDNGSLMHTFLLSQDYRRQHAPVNGKRLTGASLVRRPRYPEGTTQKKVEFRSLDAPDDAGYQWCQTRGLIIIDTVVHGKVAVLLIRMAQVSSVAMSVQKEYCVQKGDKISYFLFGGSDIAIVFQNGVKFRDDLEINKTKINVRDKLATF